MRKHEYSISRNALNQMYKSYLLPMRRLYGMDALNTTRTLQKIQNEAARLVTGSTISI